MQKYEYVQTVLGCLPRLTPKERLAVREELYAHIEDHMEALLDLGYEPELAEQRTMERMGDPEEVGRELDKQYPRRWLALKRLAKALVVVLALTLLTQVNWNAVTWNLGCRFAPERIAEWTLGDGSYAYLKEYPQSLRCSVGDTRVVCAAGVFPAKDIPQWEQLPEGTEYVAGVVCRSYPASWRDLGTYARLPDFTFGEEALLGTYSTSFGIYLVEVERGQPELPLTYAQYGHAVAAAVPLDWEGVP